MTTWRFVHPMDSLSLRGNKLFGAAGDFGASGFPPKPSVLAGAFRSALLVQAQGQVESFAAGERLTDPDLNRILGTPSEPGDFALLGAFPAWKTADGVVRILLPLPGDLLVLGQGKQVRALQPQPLPPGVLSSSPGNLPMVAILRQGEPAKPDSGWLLSEDGLRAYLSGARVESHHLVKQAQLWDREVRVGIGLSRDSRTAEDGKLFTVEHTVTRQAEQGGLTVGLAVGLGGVANRLSDSGFIRMGGDGRAASFTKMPSPELPDPLKVIAGRRRFKLVLTTPGLFSEGWRPTLPEGLAARLACAAVPRHEVISGWDLAGRRPKDAERVVPAGAVYWFDEFQGDAGKLAEWVENGLGLDTHHRTRRVEGFNRGVLAVWPD